MSDLVKYEDLTPSEQKKYWEGLHNNPAWVSLCEALQAQADNLQQEIIFAPVTGVEDTYRMERAKGNLEGRLSVARTAGGMYDTACTEAVEKRGKTDEGDE